jgi:chromate transporter
VTPQTIAAEHEAPAPRRAVEVLLVFLRLGCTSFGGPVAHMGYFRAEFVERRRWLTEAAFAELLALAHALPGPGSSQVGFAIGLRRGGWMGGLAAWLGFTLPSALLMLAFAAGHVWMSGATALLALHGLQLLAVAVVAQAVWAMQRSLAPDLRRLLIAAFAAAVTLLLPSPFITLAMIVAGALAGMLLCREGSVPVAETQQEDCGISRRGSFAAMAVVAIMLLSASLLRTAGAPGARFFSAMARSGALVFGGGHVVLPLLEQTVVAPGWMRQTDFLAGYAAAQALPGPLFAFGAYVGATVGAPAHPLRLGLLGLIALFAPGLLLMAALLPFWSRLRRFPGLAAALRGINASVVGLLLAALIRPLAVSTLRSPLDWLLAAAAFAALVWAKVPAWALVLAVVAFASVRALL